jgi:hypothetical protein
MTIVALAGCLKCGASVGWLGKLETINLIGNQESLNPVVTCANCGSLMVRVGGLGGQLGWALHAPADVVLD